MEWKINHPSACCTLLVTACFYLLSMVDIYFIFWHEVWLLLEHTFIFHFYNILDFCCLPWLSTFFFLQELDNTERGTCGFGSTGYKWSGSKYVRSEHKRPLQFQKFSLKEDTTSAHLGINQHYHSYFTIYRYSVGYWQLCTHQVCILDPTIHFGAKGSRTQIIWQKCLKNP